MDASTREKRRSLAEKRSDWIIATILGAVLGTMSLGAVGLALALWVEEIPWWHGAGLGMAGGCVLGSGLGSVRGMQRPIKRACLALGAFEFQRSYWLGGVMSLIAVLSTFAEEPPWFVELFAERWVGYVVIGAILAPPVFTAISELAFWAILRLGIRQNGPLPQLVWADDLDEDSSPSAGTKRGPRFDLDEKSLVKIDFEPGGVKRIVAYFVANVYRSHFFSYEPYSVDLDLRGMQHDFIALKRGILLATRRDADDFTKHGVGGFDYIPVCPFCWVLRPKPINVRIERVEAD